MPLSVCILVPVHNVSKYLDRCLNSIIYQDYKYKQIVVIDDGSKDDSFNICQRYAKKYPFISIFTREHQGIAKTRKDLLEQANGDFILFVDADDWIESDMVSNMMQLATENDADMVMCGMLYGNRPLYPMNLNAKSDVSVFGGDEMLYNFLNNGRLMNSLCNKLIKKTLYNGLHYREDLLAGEDLYMMWQILPKVNKVVCTPSLHYHYENIAGSLTRRSDVFNAKISFQIWNELEKESNEIIPRYRSNVHSTVFYEATSYAYALLKHNDITARRTIDALIPEFKKRLPYLKIKTRLQLLKALWGLSGIIAGYPFMKIIYKIYNRIF